MSADSQPDRCRAGLKYFGWRWRCHRRAVGPSGLCSQHRFFGCRVPAGWTHHVNEHGVDVPTPVYPFERVAGRRERGTT